MNDWRHPVITEAEGAKYPAKMLISQAKGQLRGYFFYEFQ